MAISSLQNRISTLFSTMFQATMLKPTEKQTDHRRLTNYIITINQKESTEEILKELSYCLKDILNYQLFAFVIQQESAVDIWLDPRIYKQSLERIVIKDFNIKDKGKINYLNYTFSSKQSDTTQPIELENLSSYKIIEEDYFARIYILAEKGMPDFHDDEIDMILRTTQTAISRQIDMKKLSAAAAIDPLTQCYNRRELETQLKRSVSNALRYKKELSIFMFDLDHFKHINDTYGHQAGDKVLKKVSLLVQNRIRTSDILARYGGEEFIAILPETSKLKAMELANRIRQDIADTRIKIGDRKIRVTASFGVADLSQSTDINSIVHDADTMMYKAKLNGRNTVMPGLIKVCPSVDSKNKTLFS